MSGNAAADVSPRWRPQVALGAGLGFVMGSIYAILYHTGEVGAAKGWLTPIGWTVELSMVAASMVVFAALRYAVTRFRLPNHGIITTLLTVIALGIVALWWGSWYTQLIGGLTLIGAVRAGVYCDMNLRIIFNPDRDRSK
jgi:hypothetical protein